MRPAEQEKAVTEVSPKERQRSVLSKVEELERVERERDEAQRLARENGYALLAQRTRADRAEKKAFDQHVMVGEAHTQLERVEQTARQSLEEGLLGEAALRAFDRVFVTTVWAEDGMPALPDYERGMKAALTALQTKEVDDA